MRANVVKFGVTNEYYIKINVLETYGNLCKTRIKPHTYKLKENKSR